MTFINIPVKVWNGSKNEYAVLPRLFNPAHIVALSPLFNNGLHPEGIPYTLDGMNHVIPSESYHEAFVAIMGSEPVKTEA